MSNKKIEDDLTIVIDEISCKLVNSILFGTILVLQRDVSEQMAHRLLVVDSADRLGQQN